MSLCRNSKPSPTFAVTKPDATFYALPDFRAYSNNSVELSNFLLKKAMVVTVPGKEFGMEGHLRLSYAGTVKDITEGIARLKWALDPEFSQRNLYWRPQAYQGLAMNNLLRYQNPAEAQASALKSDYGLENIGLMNLRKVYWNLLPKRFTRKSSSAAKPKSLSMAR
jgi:hypothetical protein